MTAIADSVARVPIELLAPAELSDSAWRSAIPWGTRASGGTVHLDERQTFSSWRERQASDEQVQSALYKQKSFLRRGVDWDSHGARSITPAAIQAAFVFFVSTRHVPGGSIVPTSNGGVQIEWHDRRIDVEIEIQPSGDASLFAVDEAAGERVERWVVPGHPAIDAWLGRLGQAQ